MGKVADTTQGAKRVALYFFEGHVSVSPTIQSVCSFLVERGYAVDLFTRMPQRSFAPEEKMAGVEVFPYVHRRSIVVSFLYRLMQFFRMKKWRRFDVLYEMWRFSQYARSVSRKKDYAARIGVDPVGLFAASFSTPKGLDYLYLSLEIEKVDASDNVSRLVKAAEIVCQQDAAVTLVQDTFRRELLVRENHLEGQDHTFALLPNSPRGIGDAGRLHWFDEKFGFSPTTKIALSAGMISELVLSRELAAQISKTDAYVAVFHERAFRRIEDDEYLRVVDVAGAGKVFLSLEPVKYSQIDLVYRSADIGLVFYDGTVADNVAYILGASGKLSQFLKYGRPIIANDLPGFRELVEEYGCGVVIEKMDDLNAAVKTIFADYAKFSENAAHCYRDVYEFDKQFEPIFERYIDSRSS